MNLINIAMETYMQVLQKIFKINNYLWDLMWVLHIWNDLMEVRIERM
jgi:hypothetical protein